MIYYIRLLKPPPATVRPGQPFQVVWTITNDLGEMPYLESINVLCKVVGSSAGGKARVRSHGQTQGGSTGRKSGQPSHCELTYDPFRGGGFVCSTLILENNIEAQDQLMFCAAQDNQQSRHPTWTGACCTDNDTWIIPVWAPLSGNQEKHVERRVAVHGQALRIRENVGESLEGHVWDCGMVIADYLAKRDASSLKSLYGRRILELGCGTGIAGLAAASFLAPQTTFLTDIPDALSLPRINARLNQQMKGKETVVTGWTWVTQNEQQAQKIEPPVATVDLVILTDVLYNQGSHDALLDTLDWLALHNPDLHVLLAYKERHSDERVFFDEKLVAHHWLVRRDDAYDTPIFEIYWLSKKGGNKRFISEEGKSKIDK
ncbi:putative methyltransferase-domain-containing protein [Syncephalastrum racemosum]|uniref:Putative methyltransferase-domain-containing protein n=1 Tax=Syncephalastrum racemosum TaxID=13706 RepID=A0A1X2HCW7_SYNRA|nr:putative methyltransferase-domain-containing protein [Syncephalastrum racemosum]